jgi:hypothetical protein
VATRRPEIAGHREEERAMWYTLRIESGCLMADLYSRRSTGETREFLAAAEAEFLRHDCDRALISVHSSTPVFALDKIGLPRYFDRLAGTPYKIALVGDCEEQRIAHQYIEALARQHGVAVRAFRDEADAREWLHTATEMATGSPGHAAKAVASKPGCSGFRPRSGQSMPDEPDLGEGSSVRP